MRINTTALITGILLTVLAFDLYATYTQASQPLPSAHVSVAAATSTPTTQTFHRGSGRLELV